MASWGERGFDSPFPPTPPFSLKRPIRGDCGPPYWMYPPGAENGRSCRKRALPSKGGLGLSKDSPAGKPRRVPSRARGGIKSESVISGDMCLGNDSSHDGQGDNFARNRAPSVMQPFVEKGQGPFSTVSAGRPGHIPAGEHMEVQVVDRLARLLPDVGHHPVACKA